MVDHACGPVAGQGQSASARPGQIRPLRCGRRTWQWVAMAFIALAMAGGGCGGCGGCGGGYHRATEEEIAQVRERLRKKAELENKEAAKAKKKAAAERARRAKMAAAEKAAKQAKQRAARLAAAKAERPKRPQDVSAWKEEDYFSARTEGDPRLLEAVAVLGRQQAGQETAARLLGGLLEPDARARPAPDRPPRGPRLSPEQTQAILAALAANGTAQARKTLERVVTGKLVIDGKTDAQAAVQALARHPAPENEAILYRALTQSPITQTPGSRKSASGFASMVLAAVRPEAAEEFRVRLAQHVVAPGTSDSLRQRLGALLEEPRAENLAAQLFMFGRFETPIQTKAKLGEYFIAYSSEMVRRLLGVPEQAPNRWWSAGSRGFRCSDKAARAQARKAATSEPSLPTRAAAHLWTSGFAALLADRLYQVDSLEQQSLPVLLAGTIPLDRLRSSLYATLARNWQDGPGALESAGLPAQVVSDPGLVVLVKMLPHEALGAEAGRKPPTSRASVRSEVQEARLRREKVKDRWARFCGELVLATCKRLEMAARARAAASGAARGGSDDSPPTLRLPLALHESARVVARYRTTWPADVRPQLSGTSVDPVEISYVRIEETARYKKLLGHYRRHVGTRQESADSQGIWLETLRDLPGTDHKLSLDVVIRKATKDDTYEKLDRDEKLTVEILSIEIRDPTGEGSDRHPATPPDRLSGGK